MKGSRSIQPHADLPVEPGKEGLDGGDHARRNGSSLVASLARLRQRWWDEDQRLPRWQGWWWTLLIIAMLVVVADRLGATDWYSDLTVTGVDGRVYRVPVTFATHDHPFHIAKERATIDALRDGWLPRWFSFHLAGFPAEYYPAGGDLIVAAVYAVGLGNIPLEIAHKLVVIAVFFVPPIVFWAMVRRDRLPMSVGVLAAGLHLFVPGNWLGGGSDGLFRLGVWPDILAGYLALPFILWFAEYLRFNRRRGMVLATLCGALAVYTNPRSILYLAAACIAVAVVAMAERHRIAPIAGSWPGVEQLGDGTASPAGRLRHLFPLAVRAGHVPLVVGLLSSSLLIPLRANQDSYEFANYVEFANVRHVWTIYQEAMPIEVIVLGMVGLIVAVVRRGFYGRVFALLLPLSYAIIVLIGGPLQSTSFFAQVEGPRIIPMLRPATLFLAALALHEIPRSLFRLVGARGATPIAGATMVVLTGISLLTSYSPLPQNARGLEEPVLTNTPEFATLARSMLRLETLSEPTDRVMVIGNPVGQHSSFWVTQLANRDAFHDDWVWYWRKPTWAIRTELRDLRTGFDYRFLQQNGLSYVLIDAREDNLIADANRRGYLDRLYSAGPGGYAIYRVQPTSGEKPAWLTLDNGDIERLDARAERITAQGSSRTGGLARIAVNAYPAWQAEVNGQRTEIVESQIGYMLVPIPAGDVTLTLTYVVEPVVWIGRVLTAAGVVWLVAVIIAPRLRRWTHLSRQRGRATRAAGQ